MNKREVELMNRDHLERTLKRMAYQVLELAKENRIVLIGLNTRGMVLAGHLKHIIDDISGENQEECLLDHLNVGQSSGSPENLLPELSGNNFSVFIVDDVIFSGLTMLKALKKLGTLPENKPVYTAVLVDRGHRKVPVQATITGIEIPTKFNEQVEFRHGRNEPVSVVLTI